MPAGSNTWSCAPILVVFGKTHMMHYARTYQRKHQEDNVNEQLLLEGIKAPRFYRSQSATGSRKVAVSSPND